MFPGSSWGMSPLSPTHVQMKFHLIHVSTINSRPAIVGYWQSLTDCRTNLEQEYRERRLDLQNILSFQIDVAAIGVLAPLERLPIQHSVRNISRVYLPVHQILGYIEIPWRVKFNKDIFNPFHSVDHQNICLGEIE